MARTVLVTGETGFAGHHAMAALAGLDGPRVIAAVRDAGRLAPGLADEVRVGDFRDRDFAARAMAGVDTVCLGHAWSSLKHRPGESRTLFLEPVLNAIEAAAAAAAGVARVVFASTTSAAAPERSADPDSRGIPRAFWPHLTNVVAIEDRLRDLSGPGFQAVSLRLGLFVGRHYGLGLLPILLPRLKTRAVPWVSGGRTGMPLVDGRDIGRAFALAATAEGLQPYEGFNIVGPEVPSAREVIEQLRDAYGYPVPLFSVPFPVAHAFAWTMERLDPLVPWEPLVTRAVVHLLQETGATNDKAERLLGYRPSIPWREAVAVQIAEMQERGEKAMPMSRPAS